MLKKRVDRKSIAYMALFVFVCAAFAGYTVASLRTGANINDEEKSTGNSFAVPAYEINPSWRFSDGKSKATWPYPGQPPAIAQYENEKLILDFGDLRAGNCNNSPDVFRIKNNSPATVTVCFFINPEIATYFSWIGLSDGNTLAPGQEKSVEIKLETMPDSPIGMYGGVLTVSCGDGYIASAIPIRFEILVP